MKDMLNVILQGVTEATVVDQRLLKFDIVTSAPPFWTIQLSLTSKVSTVKTISKITFLPTSLLLLHNLCPEFCLCGCMQLEINACRHKKG